MPATPLRLFGAAAALAVSAAVGPFSALVPPPGGPAAPAAPAPAAPAASHAHHGAPAAVTPAAEATVSFADGAGAAAAPAAVVTITARDYAFEMPDTVVAGRTELQLVNKGAELHHAALLRLDAGKTAADLAAAMHGSGPPPAWLHNAGGPNAPAPGATSAAVVDLEPGTYVLVCMIPSPDGKPHMMKGMTRTLTVVSAPRARLAAHVRGSAAPAAALVAGAPDVTMTLTDYNFGLSRPLTRGRHVVRVRNAARQPHEVFVARLAPGKSAADALAWVEKMQGPPPLQPLGGVVGLDTGAANDIPLDLAPGEYALFCFVPDAKDGKSHTAHGMVRQFTVR
jgi:uncharacterized cupredoxin-like copper-binding protein